MAIAMIDLQTKGRIALSCRAVLVRAVLSPDLYLIYGNGEYYDQEPIKFVLGLDELIHVNQTKFVRELPKLLAGLKRVVD